MLMTHIFFSFYAPDFPSNISYLFNVLEHISSWMTANLLTLNTSKTEFLLIGLKQQPAKKQNCTLNTTHSARNLGFIPIFISKQLIQSLPPLSTLNLTTVTHYTTAYLILS